MSNRDTISELCSCTGGNKSARKDYIIVKERTDRNVVLAETVLYLLVIFGPGY